MKQQTNLSAFLKINDRKEFNSIPQPELKRISKEAKKYLRTYVVPGLSEENAASEIITYLPYVENRMKSEYLAEKSGEPFKFSLSAEEERLVIKAMQEGEQEAWIICTVFFSYKIGEFMKRTNFLDFEEARAFLKSKLYEMVLTFDLDKYEGGIFLQYSNQYLYDAYRDFIGKECILSHNRRQGESVTKLKEANAIAENLTVNDLAKKYNVSRNSVFLYLMTTQSISLDGDYTSIKTNTGITESIIPTDSTSIIDDYAEKDMISYIISSVADSNKVSRTLVEDIVSKILFVENNKKLTVSQKKEMAKEMSLSFPKYNQILIDIGTMLKEA